jgi:predicted GIY-YIG superfamily endonuclease
MFTYYQIKETELFILVLQVIWANVSTIHKNKIMEGFTKKYVVNKLVYYEETTDAVSAIAREKQLKKWNRKWKLELIEKINHEWNDLAEDWIPNQVENDKQK